MRIDVNVKPGSKKEEVVLLEPGKYKVFLRQNAIEGEANEALRGVLATFFDTSKSRIVIEKGLKSRSKKVTVVEK